MQSLMLESIPKYLLIPACAALGLVLGSRFAHLEIARARPLLALLLAITTTVAVVELSYTLGGRGATLSAYALSMGFLTLAARLLK